MRTAQEIIAMVKSATPKHELMRSVWDECLQYFMPQQYPIDTPDSVKAQNSVSDAVTGIGIRAATDMASGLFTNTMQIGEPWFAFAPLSKEMQDEEYHRRAYTDATKTVLEALQNSNLVEELHTSLQLYPVLGTGVLYMWWDYDTRSPWFKAFSIKDCMISENVKGEVNHVFRKYKLTAIQACEEFCRSEDMVPEEVMKQMSVPDTCCTEADYIHAVIPNRDYREGSQIPAQFMFEGYHIHVGSATVVRTEYHRFFPYAVYRYSRVGNHPYGVGPAQLALPDIRMAMRAAEDFVSAHEYAAQPPVFLPPGVSKDDVDLRAGAINSVMGPNGEMPIFAQNGSIDFAAMFNFKADTEKRVNEFFFSDLFRMLATAPPGMTATEVMERNNEKIQLLLPMVSKMQSELYRRIVINTLVELAQAGEILHPGMFLQKGKLDVQYVNRLAAKLNDVEVARMVETIQLSMVVLEAAANPILNSTFNFPEWVRKVAETKGMSPKLMYTRLESDAIRQAANDAAEREASREASSRMIAPMDLARKPEPGSVLSAMEGQPTLA